MATSAQQAYAESRVLSADPVELIQILYEAALDEVSRAQQHLREGDIAARAKDISQACAILLELATSVRQDVEPTLGRNLVELYDYMQHRLLEAHIRQSELPLAEVTKLLSTLLEGWSQCRAEIAAPDLTLPDGPAMVAYDEPSAHISQAWTL